MKSFNMDWPMTVVALWVWVITAVIALLTPRFSRPDLFFAITVSPSFRQTPAGRAILRRYYTSVVVVSLIASSLIALVSFRSAPLKLTGLLGLVFVQMLGWFAAFLVARNHTMPHHVEPSAEREAELRPRETSLPGGWLAQAGPFLILGAACLCLWLRWDNIPARIPIHWSANGIPNDWAAKNPAAVFGVAVIGLLICLLIAVLWRAVINSARRIYSSGNGARREARFLRSISLFLLGTEYWLALLMGMISLAALRSNPNAPLPMFASILLGQTLLIAAIFFIASRAGQGGWRWGASGENAALSADTPPVGDRTPDECWKLGLFYLNRNDPALFVEKRFGLGWTLNFANPKSWLVMGAILGVTVAALVSARLTMKGGHSARIAAAREALPKSDAEQAAVSAAQAWLKMIDDRDYAGSWKEAAPLFQRAVTQKDWEDSMKKYREPEGSVVSRKALDIKSAVPPGAPAGNYVIMQFLTDFAKKRSGVETLTFLQEKDGRWKSVGYFIK
jgi:uncharacterized membrane protein